MAKSRLLKKCPAIIFSMKWKGKKIIFGDDELSVNLASRERDLKCRWTFALTVKTALLSGQAAGHRSTQRKLSFLPAAMM